MVPLSYCSFQNYSVENNSYIITNTIILQLYKEHNVNFLLLRTYCMCILKLHGLNVLWSMQHTFL